jgi:hypothetical protein
MNAASVPRAEVTRLLAPLSHAADVILAAFADARSPHVFRSDDGGHTWRDLDTDGATGRRRLPDVPANALALREEAGTEELFVATDAGVYSTQDDGGTWHDLSAGLPRLRVTDLLWHPRTKELVAATYGRGLWRLPLP